MPNSSGKSRKSMAVAIAPLAMGHVESILEIQAKSPVAAQWSGEDYAALVRSGACGWVALAENRVRGFLVARGVAGEMEILNLAVDLACRQLGIGSALLQAARNWAKQNNVSKIHLEVRSSNQAAREFYEAQGFRKSGLRPNYYRHPVDDAILFSAEVA
jgi:[ribosomal protein S18]-alanine N-acetyltransferase